MLKRYNINLDRVDIEMQKCYGQRYLEYRRNYALAGRFQYEPEFPLYLMLEHTFRCNLRCPLCIQGFPEYKKHFNPDVAVMPRSLFERIVLEGQQYHCPSIAFHCSDEPLLIKDLAQRVAFAKEHGFMDILLTTNGNLLFPAVMRRLLNAGVTKILFSLDAATAETYKKIRPGGDYAATLRNLFALLEFKKKRRLILPAVRLSFAVNRFNAHELKAFIKLFSKKVDYLEIQPLITIHNFNTHLIHPSSRRIKDFRCNEPWRKLVIRANGDVMPCCSYYGYDIIAGNCLKNSLKDIFQGNLCKKLRKDFSGGVYRLPACASCSKSYYIIEETA